MKAFLQVMVSAVAVYAQISPDAYRSLGQPDLVQRGLNLVRGTELMQPSGIALDSRGGQVHIYIADAGNSRILGWADTSTYQTGDPPAVVLGEPGPQYSNDLGQQGLSSLAGLAVDPATGNLFVADTGNNRVVRFPSPFSNTANFLPDAVIGQPDLTTFVSGVSSSALNSPQDVAFDMSGNLWVADTGNNRILRFPVGALAGQSTAPQADMVLGQKDFVSNIVNAGGGSVSAQGFDTPSGVSVDSQNSIYVSDTNNARALKFAAPVSTNAQAISVYGQPRMNTRAPGPPSGSAMASPLGMAVGGTGTLYVAVPTENRVLAFSGSTTASTVYGQATLTTASPNLSSFPLASANGLSSPARVRVDPIGNLYVVDTGNNRVLSYPANSRTAFKVWGQSTFTGNGPNQVKASSISAAAKMAIDYTQTPYGLYVSDTNNNRVLIWKDSVKFRSGDPADLVIGQPDMSTALANVDTGSTPTATSLSSPRGIALDSSGNLYVADAGNNRVLRYPRPLNQIGRVMPDIVLGQTNFSSAAGAAVSATSLRAPFGVAIASDGEIYVADSGNNRVLKFLPYPGTGAAAVQVFGQPNFITGGVTRSISAQTLSGPSGIAVDPSYNLYVADTGNNRVLVFPGTQGATASGPSASILYGQSKFTSGGAGLGAAALHGPSDVALDSSGSVYVADTGNNRVIVFPSLIFAQPVGSAATAVIGQPNLNSGLALWDSTDGQATADSLWGPLGLYVDRKDTLYVADSGNNRLLQFLHAADVVNGAHFLPGVPVAPGSFATVFSPGVGTQTVVGSIPLPASLGGFQMMVNDTLQVPLYAVASGQINFQVPSATQAGTNRIAVASADTGELHAGGSFSVVASAPGLISVSSTGTGQGAIFNQDGTVNGAARPAARGSVVTLYGTGPGPVTPQVQDGLPAPSSPLSYSITSSASDATTCLSSPQSMCVLFGNSSFGNIMFSGLAPGWVGLWQINVQIPSNAPTGGAVPVKIVLGENPSNSVTLAIK